MRWPDCAKHNGKHLNVHGQCVHHGAPVAIRPGVCPADGCRSEVMRVMDLRDGTVRMLEAGGDQEHRHAAPIRVELDPQQLADAIVEAARAARQDRKAESAPAPQDGALRTSEGAPVRSRRVLDLGADE